MAERLIVEIGDKLTQWETELPAVNSVIKDVVADAESALVGLGFKPQEAARALAQIQAPGDEVETLIKQALKLLGGPA
jgi:Holliday junction DNA helicase RuvA